MTAGRLVPDAHPAPLRRWDQPVRLSVEFGDSVPDATRARDRAVIGDFAARRSGARPAVVECGPDGDPATGRTWTYRQLREESVTVAKALMAAGYEAGDRIGMWSPNVAEWVSLLYGAARAGVILVNLNPAYRAHELTYVVEQCDMRGLVVACADARMDPPATARAVARESAPHLRRRHRSER